MKKIFLKRCLDSEKIVSMRIEMYKKIILPILLCFLCCLGFFGCNGKGSDPVTPDVPLQYRNIVEVVYSQNTGAMNLSNLEANANLYADSLTLHYELFDPAAEIRSENDQKVEGQYRFGQLEMAKVRDNMFKGNLEKVLIQTESSHQKHLVCVHDLALSSGDDQTAQYTGKNIVIAGSCEREIVAYSAGSSGTKLKFKMQTGSG